MGDGGRTTLDEAAEEVVRQQTAESGARESQGRQSQARPGRRSGDQEGLPPLTRRISGTSFVSELGELPHGRLWQGLWLLVREATVFVVLLWLSILVAGFLVPDLAMLDATIIAVTLRVAVFAAGMVLRTIPADSR